MKFGRDHPLDVGGGPTNSTTHERVFHLDGIFEWRYTDGQLKSNAAKEKSEYAAPLVMMVFYRQF